MSCSKIPPIDTPLRPPVQKNLKEKSFKQEHAEKRGNEELCAGLPLVLLPDLSEKGPCLKMPLRLLLFKILKRRGMAAKRRRGRKPPGNKTLSLNLIFAFFCDSLRLVNFEF